MAMITCPNCSEEISDKAKTCVHCGTVLIPEEKRYCVDCGAELDEGASVCPKCGCPVEDMSITEATPQQVEVTGVRMTKKSKKVIVIVVIIAAILAFLSIIGDQIYRQALAQKAAEEAQEMRQEYLANLNFAVISMLSGAGDAETCGNLIKSVWYNAIYEEEDDSTDEYTRPNGYFVSDFNDALSNLFSDESFSADISDIKSNRDTVQSWMKNLKYPPEEYKDAYEAVNDMYDAYIALTNLVINPSGNLQTFSNNFIDADNEVLNTYNSVKVYLEN